MRCKACDKVLEPHEIVWRDERANYEELCLTCRSWVLADLYDAPMDDAGEFADIIRSLGIGNTVSSEE